MRKCTEPALRLPLQRVLAPNGLVPISGVDGDNDGGVLGHQNFVHDSAVDTAEIVVAG